MGKRPEQLEGNRKALFRELEEVGDLRRGSISANYRKCGKSNCVCAREGHPGHGPQYLWNTTIKGKSYAKSLKIGPELSKYMEEIANYKKFSELYATHSTSKCNTMRRSDFVRCFKSQTLPGAIID